MGSWKTCSARGAERPRRRAAPRRLLGLALATALACTGARAAAELEEWAAFAPPGGGFRVELPGTPRRESDERFTPMGSIRETKYWLEVDGAELAVETHDVPSLAAAWMSESALLDRARDGVIENEGGTPLASRDLVFQGAPAREFTYRYPGEPARLERVLTVLVGSRIFLLTGTGADPLAHPAVRRFFTSFRVQTGAEAAPE